MLLEGAMWQGMHVTLSCLECPLTDSQQENGNFSLNSANNKIRLEVHFSPEPPDESLAQ